jgi:hypothetical protein
VNSSRYSPGYLPKSGAKIVTEQNEVLLDWLNEPSQRQGKRVQSNFNRWNIPVGSGKRYFAAVAPSVKPGHLLTKPGFCQCLNTRFDIFFLDGRKADDDMIFLCLTFTHPMWAGFIDTYSRFLG